MSLDGCKDSSSSDSCARLFWILSASSGTSTTEACLGLVTPPSSACTSASFGSKAGRVSSSGVWGFGFDRFGSSPAFSAFAILKAWYLANLILAAISGSTGPHIWRRSRKVAEAWKVSAVCLEALFARTALSALSKVSSPNCSTYAFPATSSVTADSWACSDLN